jgi:hypothetical protein
MKKQIEYLLSKMPRVPKPKNKDPRIPVEGPVHAMSDEEANGEYIE